MEGKDDGDNGTDSSISAPTESDNGGSDDLGRSGNTDEQLDRADGAESDPGDSGDENRSDVAESTSSDNDPREIAREASLEAMEMLVSSGPIADADKFYQYTPDHQERLIRMAEAPRTDESRRRDIMVAAQTTVIKRAQWIQALLLLGCLAGAAISFWIFQEVWGGLFLGLPVMQAVGSIFKSVRDRS